MILALKDGQKEGTDNEGDDGGADPASSDRLMGAARDYLTVIDVVPDLPAGVAHLRRGG